MTLETSTPAGVRRAKRRPVHGKPATGARAAISAATLALGFLACGDDAPQDGGDGSDEPTTVVVTLRVAVPRSTPEDATVFVSGDFGEGGLAAELALERTHPFVHETTIELPIGETFSFRLTRGPEALVERGPGKEEVEPRSLVADRTKTLDLMVANWPDSPSSLSTIGGNLRVLEIPDFLEGRRVWVYLPPGYNDDQDRRYPVLYMLDGQNVFDYRTSFARSEWKVDEAVEAGVQANEVEPLVVVAVDNGGTERVFEYTPYIDANRGGGGGEAHVQAIREVLMPYIDDNYRTLSGPENTGFSGSSLGGLMSLHVAYEHADVFGRIGAVSPSLWFAERAILDRVQAGPKPDVRLWVDMGTDEGDGVTPIENFRELDERLRQQGFVEGEDLRAVVDPGGQHNEASWARRMPDILRFLFPPRS